MKYFTLLRVIFFLGPVLVIFSACQTQPDAPPSPQQLTAYAEAIRAQQIVDMTLFRECYSIGGEVSQLATDTREAWHFNNEKLIAAADTRLALSRNDWVSIDGDRYSLSSLRDVMSIAEEARTKLNLKQRSPNSQKNACQRALLPLETKDYKSMAAEPRLADALMATNTPSPPPPGGEFQFDKFAQGAEPGRSYYSIADALRSSCDSDLSLITFIHDWPREHYGAFCQGEPLVLVSCEWGDCQQHKPESDY